MVKCRWHSGYELKCVARDLWGYWSCDDCKCSINTDLGFPLYHAVQRCSATGPDIELGVDWIFVAVQRFPVGIMGDAGNDDCGLLMRNADFCVFSLASPSAIATLSVRSYLLEIGRDKKYDPWPEYWNGRKIIAASFVDEAQPEKWAMACILQTRSFSVLWNVRIFISWVIPSCLRGSNITNIFQIARFMCWIYLQARGSTDCICNLW